MEVIQYISELLIRQECVIVPGLGGFIANYSPARIHPVLHTFSPPSKDILFNASLRNNDGLLANYIAIKENLSYAEALARVQEFSDKCAAELHKKGRVEIVKVGTLFPDREGNIQFDPDKSTNFLLASYGLSDFTSPAIKREGIEDRLKRTFEENKKHRSARQSSGRKAIRRLTIVSIPAAAVLVWGVFNMGLIKDIYTNNSGYFTFFGKNTEQKTVRQFDPYSRDGRTVVHNNIFDPFGKTVIMKNPSAPDSDVVYPFITGRTSFDMADTIAATVDPGPVVAADQAEPDATLHYYIIGSCNKTLEFAENYLREIKSQGFADAGITGPSGAGYYKVYFGRYASEKEAVDGLAKVHKTNPAAWLMKL